MWLFFPCVHPLPQLITAILFRCSFDSNQFTQLLSHLSELLTEASQQKRSAWHPDKRRRGRTAAEAITHSFPSQTIRLPSSCSLFSTFASPYFSLSARSSGFCFNSSPITSHVVHELLIWSLPPEPARLSHASKHVCVYAHWTTDFYVSRTCARFIVTSQTHTQTHTSVLYGYILSFKHVSHERRYLHPETLIITRTHKRQTHQQTNYIKRIPTDCSFALEVKIYSIVYDRPAEFIGPSNTFLILQIYLCISLFFTQIQNHTSNASS